MASSGIGMRAGETGLQAARCWSSGMTTPEIELLLCCARRHREPEMAPCIQALLAEPIDWRRLGKLALAHGTLPRLVRCLSEESQGSVPPASLRELRAAADALAARSFSLTTELVRVVGVLEAGGIPVIPYKGPALAASLYGSLLLRPCSDLDLLVQPADVPRATEILITDGYQPKRALSPAEQAALLRNDYARGFLKDGGRLLLELHWGFRPRYCAFRVQIDRLWERQVAITVAGCSMRSLAPEDLLLVLCTHASWHLWARLQWIVDVAELLRAHPSLDWKAVVERASRCGCRRMLWLGLLLARDLLGAPVPEPIQLRMQGDRTARSLAAYVCRRLLQNDLETSGPREKMAERRFLLTMRERWRDRWGYCMHLAQDALPTSEADRNALPLPAFLLPLYLLLRPMRLAGKYGLAMIRHGSSSVE
jgi:hypothetical protein